MEGKLKGIVLLREDRKEYDELVTFFSREMGIINLYAFGSRSPRSFRGRNLSSFNWLELSYSVQKGIYLLESLQVLKKNDFLQKNNMFYCLSEFLKLIRKYLPFKVQEKDLFDALFLLADKDTMLSIKENSLLLFRLVLLKSLGIFPCFYRCACCGKTCSLQYQYDFSRQAYIGLNCLTHDQSGQQLPVDSLLFLNYFYQEITMNRNFFIYCSSVLNSAEQEGLKPDKKKLANFSRKLLAAF
ncbi:MAG TPA: DNA repair protein RecO [Spirochaetota bacterium]|nr:DNA repair protein RecO [Spirochaetota bacterium]